jgi:hypothetical protein
MVLYRVLTVFSSIFGERRGYEYKDVLQVLDLADRRELVAVIACELEPLVFAEYVQSFVKLGSAPWSWVFVL